MRKLAFALAFLALTNVVWSQSWETFRGDYLRTGESTAESSFSFDDFNILWHFQTGEAVRGPPSVADIDGDGVRDIVFGSDDDHLYVLDDRGRLKWEYETGGNVRSAPTLVDADGDGSVDVLFGSDDGYLYMLDNEGNLTWKYETGGMVRSSPLVEDLGGTTVKEIVFGSGDSRVYCLNPSGEKLWEYKTAESVYSSPALYDMDNDGEDEIVFGSDDNIVYIIKHPPHKVWTYQTSGDISSTPAIDRSGNVVAGSGDKRLYRLHITSRGVSESRRVWSGTEWTTERISITGLVQMWNHTLGGKVSTSPALGNIYNTDGTYGAFVGGDDGVLYMVYINGSRSRIYSVSKPIESSPAVGDLNGDNITDIVFGTNDNKVFIINHPGRSVFTFETGGPVRSSPALADLVGDGTLEVMVGSDDGKLYIFGDSRSMSVHVGYTYYQTALKYYGVGDIENAKRFIEGAKTRFNRADYTEGISECNSLLGRIEGDSHYNKAQDLYLDGDLRGAREEVETAAEVYFRAGDEYGFERADRLFIRIEADTYYEEAQYYYNLGLYQNASEYIEAARRYYASINYTEGVEMSTQMYNVSQTHGKADIYFEDGITSRKEGKYDVAEMYFGLARLSYELAGDMENANITSHYINTVKGDQYFQNAMEYLNAGDYARAVEEAEVAMRYFRNGSGEDTNKVDVLYERVKWLAQANDLYEKAEKHYTAADFEAAIEYADKAMVLYNTSGDLEGYTRSERLYQRASRAAGSGGGGIFPEDLPLVPALMIVSSLAAIGYMLSKRRKPRRWFIGGWRRYGRFIAAYTIVPAGRSISLIPPKRLAEKLSRRSVLLEGGAGDRAKVDVAGAKPTKRPSPIGAQTQEHGKQTTPAIPQTPRPPLPPSRRRPPSTKERIRHKLRKILGIKPKHPRPPQPRTPPKRGITAPQHQMRPSGPPTHRRRPPSTKERIRHKLRKILGIKPKHPRPPQPRTPPKPAGIKQPAGHPGVKPQAKASKPKRILPPKPTDSLPKSEPENAFKPPRTSDAAGEEKEGKKARAGREARIGLEHRIQLMDREKTEEPPAEEEETEEKHKERKDDAGKSLFTSEDDRFAVMLWNIRDTLRNLLGGAKKEKRRKHRVVLLPRDKKDRVD
ncbi:MAG: PQQ-binding-like beta-propeller repeat protein [Candidatus Altiarchaeales archaeon]|nr:PQQ-binding-like beta-propeller repeat protein [Candidatus Altiarchaeales archaeon]MBD3416833.1 PQQ-binding-like beta-propeller repeat protein [Candidatus Altiarchaeales archaeon]